MAGRMHNYRFERCTLCCNTAFQRKHHSFLRDGSGGYPPWRKGNGDIGQHVCCTWNYLYGERCLKRYGGCGILHGKWFSGGRRQSCVCADPHVCFGYGILGNLVYEYIHVDSHSTNSCGETDRVSEKGTKKY